MVAMPRPLNALVVDDDPGVRLTVADALETAGYCSFPVESRGEAFEVIRFHQVHFSILDMHVREDDGIQILTSLREVVVALPAIFMSGAFTPEIVARARATGARHCLEKPLDFARLIQAVNELIQIEDL